MSKYPAWVRLCALFALLFLLPSTAQAQDDWQFWHSYDLKKKLSDEFSFKIGGEQRLVDDFSNSGLANVSPGFLWHPSRYFEVGPFFRYEREKQANGDHVNERRWILEATLKAKWGPFKVSDRNRIAYRDRSSTDEWRYRNRLHIGYPIEVGKRTIEPFVSEEIFWQWNEGSFNQNRIQFGVAFSLSANTTLSLYYLIKSNRRGSDWDESQVLGTALGVSF